MNKFPKVSIWIILFKAEKYISYFLENLLNQNYKWEIEFLFRDQDKALSATKFIKKNHPDLAKKIKFFAWENIFHSWWQNALISKMTWDIYFCCSNDMFYEKDFVEKIVEKMLKIKDYWIFTCKIKRWDFQNIWEWIEKTKTNFIDSCGLWFKKSHFFYDLWQWEEDLWQFDKKNDVFWASWAFFAIQKDKIDKIIWEFWSFFDEKHIPHYKNDIDLAYRANLLWIKSYFIPEIIIFHDRQLWFSGPFSKIQNPFSKASFGQKSSFEGHFNLISKNFQKDFSIFIKFQTLLRNLLLIIFIFLFYTRYFFTDFLKFIFQKNNFEKKKFERENVLRVEWFMR